MKKILSIFFLSGFQLIFFQLYAQVPVWQWEKKMGGFYLDNGLSIAIDQNRNIYTTGWEGGSADFDPGPPYYYLSPFASNIQNAFISKLDSSGNFVWAKSVGTPDVITRGNGIALDASGNVYVTGEFSDTVDFDPDSVGTYVMIPSGMADVFILKLDSGGNFIWARHFGGDESIISDPMAIDAAGNIYTTGFFSDTVDFDPDSASVFNLVSVGTYDLFISKLDSAGNFIWAKQMNGTNGEEAKSITTDADDNIYLTGWFSGTMDFDPGPGTANMTTNGDEDIFLWKSDSAGNFLWSKQVGARNQDAAQSVTVDASGNVYATGGFADTVDFDPGSGVYNMIAPSAYDDIFILKLNSNGEFIWAKQMGGEYDDWGTSVATDLEGNVYSTGWFTSTADFDPDTNSSFRLVDSSTFWEDIFVSALDSSGNFIWAKSANGPKQDHGNSLVCDSSGNVYIAGLFASPILMFDTASLTNTGAGVIDVWVAKISDAISTAVVETGEPNSNILIYPNPVTNQLIIRGNSITGSALVRIFNILGETVCAAQTKTDSHLSEMRIDVSTLATGLYCIEITNGASVSMNKFVKE